MVRTGGDLYYTMLWTEAYLLQAFLVFNSQYEIILPMAYSIEKYVDDFRRAFTLYNPKKHLSVSGSFWIRRKQNQYTL